MTKADYIRDRLSYIKSKVEDDSKQYFYDINKRAEYIFMNILNATYGYALKNGNDIKPNFPTIDLLDTANKIAIQVTSDTSKNKVKTDTVEAFKELVKQDEFKEYSDYKIKMFYIKNKPSNATLKNWEDENLIFQSDILGIEDINTKVSANPTIATKVFKTLCEILHDKVCDSYVSSNLTIKSSIHDSSFIGRENELNAIDKMLENSNSLLLINGIGGIGKSTLANHYLYTREKKFDYYGFIDGLDSFTLEFKNSLDLKAEKEEDIYYEIISKLQKLQGKKLLVIDNVEDVEKHKKLIEMIFSLHKYDYKILFTSRRKIKQVTPYYLGTLLPADAQKLFLSYCKSDELEKVDKIINDLGLHTLFIKLVAETIKNEGYTLDDILNKFEKGELSKIEFIDEESGNDLTFNQNLQELFSMQNLKDEYVLLLKQLAVLPSIDIELSFLEEILGKERLKGRLNFLVGHGWLIENGGSYKLHQIIKEFILANYPSHFKEIETIINYFLKYEIKIEEWITIFLESVANFCIQYSMEDKKVGDLYYLLGRKYHDDLANIRKAEIYLNNAKKLYVAVENVIDIDIYHRLGCINNNLYYLNKALSHYEKEGSEEEKAVCLDDIGTAYWKQNELNEALVYFEKSLELLKENDFRGRAINYNQQSLVYKNKNEICKAFKYQLKAIKAIKKAREEDNSKLNKREEAQLINNLGELYMDETEQYTKAFNYLKEALDLREKILYAGHERFGESYDNLAIIENKLGNINSAKEYQLEAIEIWEKSPPEKDSYLEDAKKRLKGFQKC